MTWPDDGYLHCYAMRGGKLGTLADRARELLDERRGESIVLYTSDTAGARRWREEEFTLEQQQRIEIRNTDSQRW